MVSSYNKSVSSISLTDDYKFLSDFSKLTYSYKTLYSIDELDVSGYLMDLYLQPSSVITLTATTLAVVYIKSGDASVIKLKGPIMLAATINSLQLTSEADSNSVSPYVEVYGQATILSFTFPINCKESTILSHYVNSIANVVQCNHFLVSCEIEKAKYFEIYNLVGYNVKYIQPSYTSFYVLKVSPPSFMSIVYIIGSILLIYGMLFVFYKFCGCSCLQPIMFWDQSILSNTEGNGGNSQVPVKNFKSSIPNQSAPNPQFYPPSGYQPNPQYPGPPPPNQPYPNQPYPNSQYPTPPPPNNPYPNQPYPPPPPVYYQPPPYSINQV